MVASDITGLLHEWAAGDAEAVERLMPLVYEELRGMARTHKYRWGKRDLETGSIVHEAYLKLVDQTRVELKGRRQFFHLASLTMRSILVDNARAAQRKKRGGDLQRVDLEDQLLVSRQRSDELLALDEALTRLEQEDERLGRIVTYRFFGGLSIEETADALEVSTATIKRGWSLAKAWLLRELKSELPQLS